VILYAAAELDPAERAAVDEHVKSCAACAAALERERRLHGILTAQPRVEPTDRLLHRCRTELGESLDDAVGRSPGWRRWWESFRAGHWLMARPALASALLVLIGVVLGYGVPLWLQRSPEPISGRFVVRPTLTEEDLVRSSILGIHPVAVADGGLPSIEIQLAPETTVELKGTVMDSQVRRVLTYVVQNGQRFDADLRLDSVEVLRAASEDSEVQKTLCFAARKDRDPAVRLRALEALRGLERSQAVREVFQDALLHDQNPGARIVAIGALKSLLEQSNGQPDQRLVEVLRDRMARDPNPAIRLQSAAAIRQIERRQSY